MKLSIIDADGLTYQSSKESLVDSFATLDEKINNIFIKTQADLYCMLLSDKRYFRHDIYPAYKGQRKPTTLKWINTLKSYLKDFYGAVNSPKVEADDIAAYCMNTKIQHLEGLPVLKIHNNFINLSNLNKDALAEQTIKSKWITVEKILCSPDKDLLNSIPGHHFNYTYKEVNERLIKGWSMSPLNTETFLKEQMIIGDPADNVKGVEGKGIAYFNKMENKSWESIFRVYRNRYGIFKGSESFNQNLKILRLLDNQKLYTELGLPVPEFGIQIVPHCKQDKNPWEE